MSKESLVTIELNLLVESDNITNVVNDFDGLIAVDGLHIVNLNGDKLVVECMDSKFTEVVNISNDEEMIVLNKKPTIKYYTSSNNVIRRMDIIRISEKGDFNIIMNSNFSFLFNSESLEVIDLGSTQTVDGVKEYLDVYFPTYVVLRKVD